MKMKKVLENDGDAETDHPASLSFLDWDYDADGTIMIFEMMKNDFFMTNLPITVENFTLAIALRWRRT